jgi:hypothetical protein
MTRRHPDIGHDDVGPLALDRLQQRGKIIAGGDHLEVRLRLQEPPHPLAHEVVVLRQHDPDVQAGNDSRRRASGALWT